MEQKVLDIISGIGNFQELIVCNLNFTIPQEVPKLDLSIDRKLTPFLDILGMISERLWIEELIIAQTTEEYSPQRFQEISSIFPGIKMRKVSEIEFAVLSKTAKSCIRTGEIVPYSNIILVTGVTD